MKKVDPKKRGKGRPSLGDTIMVPIRLPAAMIAEIDAVAGPGKRSEFIREAITRELALKCRAILSPS